jgi:type II secretion system protein N
VARPRRRPRAAGPALRAGWIALGCALLTVFFFAVRFPYERFRAPLAALVAAASGAEVQLGTLGGGLGLGGITLEAAPVTLLWPTGARLELAGAAVRPAWSLSWLRGRPALHVDLRAAAGRLRGTVWPGPPLAFAGGVRGLAIEQLPPELLSAGQGFALTGSLDADVELAEGDAGLGGTLDLDVREGAFSAPGSPVSIPFTALRAELGIDPTALRVASATLEGPMIGGSAAGRVGLVPDPAQGALDLQVELQAADPSVRQLLSPLGVRLDGQGRGRLHLQGTVARPLLR